MVQRKVAPPIGVPHGVVELDVQLAQPDDVGIVLVRVVHPVVGLGETEISPDHQISPELVKCLPSLNSCLPQRSRLRERLSKRFKHVRGRVTGGSPE